MLITKTRKARGLFYHLPGMLGFLLSFTAAIALVLINQDRFIGMIWHTQQMSATISSSAALAMVNSKEEVHPAVQPPAPVLSTQAVKAAEDVLSNNKDAKNYDDNDDRIDQDTLLRKFRNGKKVKMTATAYCLNSMTASGVMSKYGIVAADPKLLPIGSVIQIEADQYSGLYTVLDTGELIKGRKIDIYLANYNEACNFGRRKIRLKVLRYGWNPQASAPAF